MQVGPSVFLLFAIVLVLGLLTIAATSRVEQETHLFEVTSNLLFEIDQERHYSSRTWLPLRSDQLWWERTL
jgi:hypothetical protein